MSLDLFAEATGRRRFAQTLRLARALEGGAERRAAARRRRPGHTRRVLRLEPASVGYRRRLAWATVLRADARVLQRAQPHLKNHEVLPRQRLDRAVPPGSCARSASSRSFPATARSTSARRSWRPARAARRGADPNYIAFLRSASFDDLINERLPEGSSPEAVARSSTCCSRHSVLLAYSTTALRILIRKGRLPNQPTASPCSSTSSAGATPAPTPTLLRAATTRRRCARSCTR